MNPQNQTNPANSPTADKNKGKNRNKWAATIVILFVVIVAELLIFHQYSLWFKPQDKALKHNTIVPVASPFSVSPAPNPVNSAASSEPSPAASPLNTTAKPPLPANGSTRDIVSMEGIQLMEKAPRFAYLRGIAELEGNTATLLNPERERKLLEALKEMKASIGSQEALEALESKTKELFFSSINQTQAKIVESKMAQWDDEDKNLGEEEINKYREKKIDECLKILEQRTGPIK